MIDFPVADLFDDSLCLAWLERHLHPDGFICPQCGSANRRLFRTQGYYDAYRCRVCAGYYTLLSGTAFEGSRQRPATLLVLHSRVMAPMTTTALLLFMSSAERPVKSAAGWSATVIRPPAKAF